MGAGAYVPDGDRGHPAFHARRRASGAPGERLFPSRTGRASERTSTASGTPVATYRDRGDPEVARTHADAGEGSGGPGARSCRRQTHIVRPGETLWSIAGAVLGTTDEHRIARYWPRIHRNNRALIGSTPDMIRPGWALRLPPECD
jgi:nucleoid-associated protein YgaU